MSGGRRLTQRLSQGFLKREIFALRPKLSEMISRKINRRFIPEKKPLSMFDFSGAKQPNFGHDAFPAKVKRKGVIIRCLT